MLLVQYEQNLMDIDGLADAIYDDAMDILLAMDRRQEEYEFEEALDDIEYELGKKIIQAWDYDDDCCVHSPAEIDAFDIVRGLLPEFDDYCDHAPLR